MIPLQAFQGQTYYVVGLARSGLATLQALKAASVPCYAWDDDKENRREAQRILGLDFILSPENIVWDNIDALVLSPGIPHHFPKPHPVAERAHHYNIPIICDIDLLAQACPNAFFIVVTGTNGKSTTTALMTHLLEAQGREVQLGGNIGVPVLALEPYTRKDQIYVLELSSFQLERCPHLEADCVVWLNITEDHIDRHGNLEGYVDAKKNVFTPLGTAQHIVMNIKDPYSQGVYKELKQDTAKTIDIINPQAHKDLIASSPLRGAHNAINLAAAIQTLAHLGISVPKHDLHTFKGLPHRQELCAHVGPLLFVNDSKATNFDSTQMALATYKNIHLILGGIAKETGITGIENFKEAIQKVYLIGLAAPKFQEYLEMVEIPSLILGDLESATRQAYKDASTLPASSEVTILLSPACASYDQYTNFEERGEHFKKIVKELVG